MRDALTQLQQDAAQRITVIRDAPALDALEVELLGRKQGTLTVLLRGLGELPPAERAVIGKLANTVKASITKLLAAKRTEIIRGRMATLAESEWIDVTAPGQRPPLGHLHPISEAIHDITAIFERIGFLRARHPEVDSDFYAFEALNMPPDHPARDEWETFFVAESPVASATQRDAAEQRLVLTPHTSNGQVREMENGTLPIRMVNIGRCYRRQIDATHAPMFHQFEGLLIDRAVSVTHLKGTIDHFVRSYFGPHRRTRLRPFHFRFTEPSFEIDISCAVCGGTGVREHAPDGAEEPKVAGTHPVLRTTRAGTGHPCRVCKSGWLELGGAGMVHPNVLRAGGIDPDAYSGFAFGWGVERVCMMKLGMSDIRLLYGNDLRWLAQ